MLALKASWKNYLLSNPDFEVSNKFLPKIKDLSTTTSSFESVFEEVSKNHGIAFIALDPS